VKRFVVVDLSARRVLAVFAVMAATALASASTVSAAGRADPEPSSTACTAVLPAPTGNNRGTGLANMSPAAQSQVIPTLQEACG
jgi:hypothetical protein